MYRNLSFPFICQAKLSDAQVAELRAAHEAGTSFGQLGKLFGISRVHAARIAKGLYR